LPKAQTPFYRLSTALISRRFASAVQRRKDPAFQEAHPTRLSNGRNTLYVAGIPESKAGLQAVFGAANSFRTRVYWAWHKALQNLMSNPKIAFFLL
jgi:hypothetical protein